MKTLFPCVSFSLRHMVCAVSIAALTSVSIAAPQPQPVSASECAAMAQSLPAMLAVQANFHESIMLPMTPVRIAIAQPEIADVALVGTRNLLIQGKKSGATSVMLWTACSQQPVRMQVSVQSLSAQLTRKAGASDDVPSQVQADIRFVEVSRSRLKDIGTRFQFRSLNRTNFASSPGGGVASAQPLAGTISNLTTQSDSFNILWGGSSSRFLGAINLLEESGYAYTLSKPSLVAMSGQTATFLAGGEVPIPVPQGQNGTIAIEYKEFGVRLSLTPTIVSRQKIILKVAPEVSDLDFANALTIQGSIIPALRVRRADTSISLADGESFVIGGLLNKVTTSNVSKFPGLGSIPVLGAFFRSNRFDAEDRELLMIVTPRLVAPLAATATLPSLPGAPLSEYNPSTAELYFLGDRYLNGPTSGLSR